MKTVIDERGLVSTNEPGNSTFQINIAASIGGSPIATQAYVSGTLAIPANPHFYVASTGNDGTTHTGLVSDPLSTVAEALRRLAVSGWSGQPIITVVNSINEGASPIWNIPAPIGSASPVLIQGTAIDSGLGVVAATGGVLNADIKVGALAAASNATVWNGGASLASVQTDMANAASQMCRVGP